MEEVEVMILAQGGTADDLVVMRLTMLLKTAKYLGLKVTGTIGVLLKAKRGGIIPGDCFRSRKNEKERILYQRKAWNSWYWNRQEEQYDI